LDEDAKISLQYQNESGALVSLTTDSDLSVPSSSTEFQQQLLSFSFVCCHIFNRLQAAGSGVNVLFAEIVEDDDVVIVRRVWLLPAPS
jgi:hypothetical protein